MLTNLSILQRLSSYLRSWKIFQLISSRTIYFLPLQFRNVRLKRHPDGGLGFSVKGGIEHNLPILVSKVCRNEDDDHLYIGDAILKVNHRSLGAVTHDEAVDLLRGAGDEVSLTVKHYKSAAPFLLKQLRQMIPEMDDAAAKGTCWLGGTSGCVTGNRNIFVDVWHSAWRK